MAIDQAAAQVRPGQTLGLLAPFEPVPLYAKLEQQGFTHRSRELPDGTWEVEFTRVREMADGAVEPIACSCGH